MNWKKYIWLLLALVAGVWFAYELAGHGDTRRIITSALALTIVLSGLFIVKPLPDRFAHFKQVVFGWYGFWVFAGTMTVLCSYCPHQPFWQALLVTFGAMSGAIGALWLGFVSISDRGASGFGVTATLRAAGSPRVHSFALFLGLSAPLIAIVMAIADLQPVWWFGYLSAFGIALAGLALRGFVLARSRRWQFFHHGF